MSNTDYIQTIYDFDCIHNALYNFLQLANNEIESNIWFIETPVGPHAYLELQNGKIISEGATWHNNYYPELSEKDLADLITQGLARNITTELLDTYYNWERLTERPEFILRVHALSEVLEKGYPVS